MQIWLMASQGPGPEATHDPVPSLQKAQSCPASGLLVQCCGCYIVSKGSRSQTKALENPLMNKSFSNSVDVYISSVSSI